MRLLPVALFALCSVAHAQTVVHGRITDAQTGDGLPAATVQVEGTSRGTVTNREGEYQLVVPTDAASGARLVVRFVGYEEARRLIPEGGGPVDIALAPSVSELGEAVVTVGNPAEAIMRRVIERKQRWRAGLQTWQAEVYSRQTIRARGEVVAVIEGQTDAFWDRERGLREVVKATRRTGNLGALPLDAFAAAEETLNLYDDDVPFGGYDLVGPTHPRALSFYRFTLEGRRAIGADLVYDLSFAPRNPLQPGLDGTLSVLADADALLSVSARPSGAVQFPLVDQFDLTFEQQFSSFGQEVAGEPVWLPVDFRMNGEGRPGNALLRFPHIGFAISSRLTDYAVNVALPDSLFESETVTVDSASVAEALPEAGVVPLSDEEERALAEIDSTRSLADALQPTGPLARFVNLSVRGEGPSSGTASGRRLRLAVEPEAWYNRVEGAHLGAGLTVRYGRSRTTLQGGYQTAAEDGALQSSTEVGVGRSVWVGGGAHRMVSPLASSFYVRRGVNSVAALLGGEDYFDYARRQGGYAWVGWWGQEAPFASVLLRTAYDDYDPAVVGTRYSLLGDDLPADNALADARDVGRVEIRLRLGPTIEGVQSGMTGQKGATVWVEGGRLSRGVPSQPATTYARVEGDLRWSTPTLLHRRLLSPTLHLRLAAGTATSGLPVQRAFGIDGRLAGLAPFGALRARTGRLTLAQRYALVAWEHDFRSVPFELLGWRGASPRGVSLQIHGAHAWADGAPRALHVEPSVVHHEVGASVGLGYTVPIRIDVTYRLTDTPGAVVGVGLARLF